MNVLLTTPTGSRVIQGVSHIDAESYIDEDLGTWTRFWFWDGQRIIDNEMSPCAIEVAA